MVLVWRLDLIKEPIRLDYLGAAFAVLPMVMVLWATISLIQLAQIGHDKPISEMWNRLRYQGPMMVLAVVIFPLFLAAFTIAKAAFRFWLASVGTEPLPAQIWRCLALMHGD
ncbi:MAG: hypothetical protein NVS3B5_05690 [Sphingomicrobium sp.]